MNATTWRLLPVVITAVTATGAAHGQVTPVWFDGFDVTEAGGTTSGASSFNINEEIGPPRQGGPLTPTAYVTNTADSMNDFRHQLFPPSNGFQPLQLAGDAGLPGLAPTLVSPDQSFSGPIGDDVLGKRVTFALDVASFNAGDSNNAFINFGVTLGAAAPLVVSDSNAGDPNSKFGINFIEDTIGGGGLGAFLQFFDGAGNLTQNVIANPAGFGIMDVQIDIDDPLDNDPWNGVGSTVYTVSINGAQVGDPQVFGGGGMTSNYLTFGANRDFVSQSLTTNILDNLTVYSGPAIPEPTSAALAAIGCLLAARSRR